MIIWKLSVALLTLFIFAAPAYAYIDPGTGSLVIQMVIAGVAIAAFYLKRYWTKVKAFITRYFVKDNEVKR